MTFLDEVASRLIENHGKNFEEVAVVLPSKRAALFLKKALAAKLKETFWSPTSLNFSDLVDLFHDEIILDKTSLAFELYEVYKNSETNPEPFDQFYKWGEILLADYNEIDLYLLDADDVFRDLKNIHQLESWNVDSYTEMQERYLGFWAKLGPLYKRFKQHLKERGLTYSGAIYNKVSTRIKLDGVEKSGFKQIYFVGLNAISPSEIDIIKTFQRNIPTEVIWDMDQHYVENNYHEAGLFYRNIKSQNPDLEGSKPPNYLDTSDTKITIYESTSYVGQAKIAAQIIDEIAPIISFEKCAVILPEPSILLPVIRELPLSVEQANVTMGYPVDRAELFSLLQHVLNLQDNIRKNPSDDSVYLHFKPLLKVIKHPILRSIYQEEMESLEYEITYNNKVFVREEDLNKLSIFQKARSIFTKWEDLCLDGIKALKVLLSVLKDPLVENAAKNQINLEALFAGEEILSKLEQMLTKYPYITQLATFRRVLNSAFRNHELSFFGEPLSGLQIMGLMETRALDFENLIILSMNEGIVPKGRQDSSILPFDLKRYHELPSTKEHDSVLAYYFFRLIQRAKNVHLVYAPISDGFGPGEKSRFLLQLEQELDQAQINYRNFSTHISSRPDPTSIRKDELFYSQLLQYLSGENKGLSVSALNRFIRCPLDFYYTYICGLREENQVEEQIEDSSMGLIVHGVLEDLYKPYVGNKLEAKNLEDDLGKVSKMVEERFLDHLRLRNLHGNNFISKEIAITQVKRVLQMDLDQIKEGKSIELIGTEEVIYSYLDFVLNGEAIKIKLTGAVDRIDRLDGEIRVIDYKTGGVTKNSVMPLSLDRPFQQRDEKSLQLAYYSFIYGQKHPEEKVSGWIFAIRNTQNVQFRGEVKETGSFGPEFLSSFEERLRQVLTELTDPNLEIQHNPSSEYCRVC